ncbi:MAG: hypothetical protein ACE5Q3_09535 [Alphaproteobacteria bacterium]
MRPVIIILTILLVSGCAARQPSPEEIARADYGPYPTDYKQAVRDYASNFLKDPYSAQYRFVHEPEKGWAWTARGFEFGWRVCSWVNARNEFGEFTGEKPWQFLIRDDSVIERIVNTEKGYRLCV